MPKLFYEIHAGIPNWNWLIELRLHVFLKSGDTLSLLFPNHLLYLIRHLQRLPYDILLGKTYQHSLCPCEDKSPRFEQPPHQQYRLEQGPQQARARQF